MKKSALMLLPFLLLASCTTVDRTAAVAVCQEKGFTSSECQMARMVDQANMNSAQSRNTVAGGAGGGLGGAAAGAGIGCAASGIFCPGGAIIGGLIGLVVGGLGGAAVGATVDPTAPGAPTPTTPLAPAAATVTPTSAVAEEGQNR